MGDFWTPSVSGGTDDDAIHDNVAGEINALTEVTPVSGDWLMIEDASDSNNKKKIDVSHLLSTAAATSFTPTITASTTNPTLGAGGSISGNYIDIGGWIIARVTVQFGTSGVAAGSGTYLIGNLPAGLASLPNFDNAGFIEIRDNNTSVRRVGGTFWNGSSRTQVGMTEHGTANVVSHNTPIAFAASDQIYLDLSYPAA